MRGTRGAEVETQSALQKLLQLVSRRSVAYLSHGNNGVRDGRSNVGTCHRKKGCCESARKGIQTSLCCALAALSPITMKIAGSTGMDPAPTRLTMMLVVVDELWRRTVTSIPTMREATGLVLPPKRPAAAHPVRTLAPVPRSSREKMNLYICGEARMRRVNSERCCFQWRWLRIHTAIQLTSTGRRGRPPNSSRFRPTPSCCGRSTCEPPNLGRYMHSEG